MIVLYNLYNIRGKSKKFQIILKSNWIEFLLVKFNMFDGKFISFINPINSNLNIIFWIDSSKQTIICKCYCLFLIKIEHCIELQTEI